MIYFLPLQWFLHYCLSSEKLERTQWFSFVMWLRKMFRCVSAVYSPRAFVWNSDSVVTYRWGQRRSRCLLLAKVCKTPSHSSSVFLTLLECVFLFLSCVSTPETDGRSLRWSEWWLWAGVNLLCLAEFFSSFCQLLNWSLLSPSFFCPFSSLRLFLVLSPLPDVHALLLCCILASSLSYHMIR